MLLTPEMRIVVVAALGVFIGVSLVFGHRSCDKADKFDEKTNELNEIRLQMRSKDELPALDELQEHVAKVNKKKKRNLSVSGVFYDTEERAAVNEVINRIEHTFRSGNRVREALDSLISAHRQLGRAIYTLVAIVGSAGYGLILLDSGFAFLESEIWFALLCDLLVVLIILRLQVIFAKSKMIGLNEKVYQKAKRDYLIDEVRTRG